MADNTCISCGAIIPEGRHICLSCEQVNDVNSFSPRIITNGDRIRNMTDEELAKLLTGEGHPCNMCAPEYYCSLDSRCVDGVLLWLRQKVNP